jgi:hypothetical protein
MPGMNINRATLVFALAAATAAGGAAIGVPALAAPSRAAGVSAAATAPQGSIRVKVTANGAGYPRARICATRRSAPHAGRIVGRCARTGPRGFATLRRVPSGRWFVTLFEAGVPAESTLRRVAVHGGAPVSVTFPLRPAPAPAPAPGPAPASAPAPAQSGPA